VRACAGGKEEKGAKPRRVYDAKGHGAEEKKKPGACER
jgi:hypothetical protein